MARSRLQLLRTIPGSTALGPIVHGFCRGGTGVVTAFSDALLPVLKAEVDEDTLVEAMPFGELARRFLEMSGEEALRIAPAGHTLAAIAEACLELPDDSPFRRTARYPGFHQAAMETLHELNGWGLMAEEFQALSERTEGRLSSKLASLAILDRESRRMLNLLGLDTHAAHLRACFESTPERDGAFDRLLVFAGAEETPLKLRWLRWVAEQGIDVTVVTDRHSTDGRVFAGAKRAASILGVEPQDLGEGNRLLNNLFAEKTHEGVPIEVTIASAADPLAEAEQAMRRILSYGAPDKSAIFVRNLEAYAPLIEASAKRLGVPIRMARRAPLLTNSLTRITLTAMEFTASGDVRSIGPILQSSYLGLDGQEQAAVVSGLKECHRTGDVQWLTLRTWVEAHQPRYEWLLKLLQWRHENAGTARTLSEWWPRVRVLMDDVLPVFDRSKGVSDYSQERDRRAKNQMLRLLAGEASIANATERGTLSLAEFVSICRRLWECADVSVPSGEYGACVTAVPECLEDADTVIVLGMLEGVFPRRRTEDPVLTDLERVALSELYGGPPLRTSRSRAEEERDAFYRVCAHARRRLVLTYPQADDSRDNVPAFYLELVKAAQPNVVEETPPRSLFAPPSPARADEELREALDGPRVTPSPVEVVSSRARQELSREDQPVAPNELRDASTCAFMYLSRHRLKLRPKRTAARWASLRSLPHLATLPRHATEEQAERALMEALDAHLDSLYSEVPGWEMQLLRSGGRRLIQDWVRREFRARRIWPKNDDSVKVNVGFGTQGLRDALWNGLKLAGVVPAVSEIDNLRVAHLYSGSAREGDKLTDTDRMYLGVYLASLHAPGKEVAVEMESMSGRRTLYTLTRAGSRQLTGDVGLGLSVVDLAELDDPVVAKKQFYDGVKRQVSQAALRIRDGAVEVTPGDHCDWCDYGELCRRSRAFGEEDSPFGADTVQSSEEE